MKPTGITNDNPGMKMMLKMGWGGGGLGTEEEGMQEPVNVDEQIVDRQGFGFREANGISSDFLTNVRKTLEDFSRSGALKLNDHGVLCGFYHASLVKDLNTS